MSARVLQRIPIYDIRLVQSRRSLRLAETKLDHAALSATALHALIGLTDREHFACLFLNGQNNIVGAHVAAIGGQHIIGAIDSRTILRAGLAACASAMVVGHNHPSGDALPSSEDLDCTLALMRAGEVIGIPVVDHVIVTRNANVYHSMFERGTLPRLD